MVISVIANTLQSIDSVMSTDELLDKLEDRLPGSSGHFGTFIDPEPWQNIEETERQSKIYR